MNEWDAQGVIREIRIGIDERNQIISALYGDKNLRRIVIGTLFKYGCNQDEAEDFFTEAIVNFIKSCYKPGFEINSRLDNYLTGTAKNLWLKELARKSKRSNLLDSLQRESDPSIEVILIEKERKRALMQILGRLDETCKKILNLWALQKKMKEIAQTLSYKSEGMARKKKHQCLRRLYAIVEGMPRLKKELCAD